MTGKNRDDGVARIVAEVFVTPKEKAAEVVDAILAALAPFEADGVVVGHSGWYAAV